MKVNSGGQTNNPYELRGKMKVSNDMAEVKDGFTPSGDKSAIGDFFHNLSDKIEALFAKAGSPQKEGAYIPNPNGDGFIWCKHPDPDVYDPIAQKSDGGCFCLKQEACAPDVWYWRPYSDPENEHGPYGMGGYKWEGNNLVHIKNPDPKDYSTGGQWSLDTACGGFSWYWEPDKPAQSSC